MDLQLLGRVLWRFRVLVAIGVAFAFGLACLSYLSVEIEDGRPSISYREKEQWESLSTLFLTTKGFPWGSVLNPDDQLLSEIPSTSENAEGTMPAAPPPVDPSRRADLDRLIALASMYLEFATRDEVLNSLRKEGEIDGTLKAFPVYAGGDTRNAVLPMITLSAISDTKAKALGLAQRHQRAFRDYITRRQNDASLAPEERVVVEVVRHPQEPELLAPRKKTRPIIVFLAVMVAVVGMAFVLENIRPRVRPVANQSDEPKVPRRSTRRSA